MADEEPESEEIAGGPSAAPEEEDPNAATLESAMQRLRHQAHAANAGGALSEVELLRRAFNSAMDDADLAARLEAERKERERMALEPSLKMKEDLKWKLFDAVWQGDRERVSEILATKGSDPNVRQKFGVTPLHRAARLGNMAISELLLKHGANAAALDDVEMTPAAYAQEKGHALLMTLLKKWEQEPGAAQSAGPSLSQTYP